MDDETHVSVNVVNHKSLLYLPNPLSKKNNTQYWWCHIMKWFHPR